MRTAGWVIVSALLVSLLGSSTGLPLQRLQQQLHARENMRVWTYPANFQGAVQVFPQNSVYLYTGFPESGISAEMVKVPFKTALGTALGVGIDGLIADVQATAKNKVASVSDVNRAQGPLIGGGKTLDLWQLLMDAHISIPLSTAKANDPKRERDTHWGLLVAKIEVTADTVAKTIFWIGGVDNAPKAVDGTAGAHTEARIIAAITPFLTELITATGKTAFGNIGALAITKITPVWILEYQPCGTNMKNCDAAVHGFDRAFACTSVVGYKTKLDK